MQRQPFADVEAEPECPIRPGDLVAVDREARAFGLGDLDRLQVGARRHGVRFGVPLPSFGGHRKVELVDDLGHPARREIDIGNHTVDRMRPRQIGLVVLVERQHPHHAPAHLVLVAEHAGRQRNRAHVLRVEPSLVHGVEPFGALEQERLDVLELLVEDRDVAFVRGVDRLLCHDAVVGDRHQQVSAETGRPVQQQDSGATFDRVAGAECEHRFLVRLIERDVDEANALVEQAVCVDDAADRADLIGGQRRQRMIRCRGTGLVDGVDGGGAHRAFSFSIECVAGVRSQRRDSGATEEGAYEQHADHAGQGVGSADQQRKVHGGHHEQALPGRRTPGPARSACATFWCPAACGGSRRRRPPTSASSVRRCPPTDTPANQANTCVTGSSPTSADAITNTSAGHRLHRRRDMWRCMPDVGAAAPRRQRRGVAQREDVACQHVMERQQTQRKDL